MILRHHGGAALPLQFGKYLPKTTGRPQTQEKSVLPARWPANPDGATLFIDIGTRRKRWRMRCWSIFDLRIVTNETYNVATTLMVKRGFPALFWRAASCAVGMAALSAKRRWTLSQFRLDFGILGISGVDSDGSLLEFDYHEVRAKRAIIENSRHVMLVVVDHSKFGGAMRW